MVKTSMNIEENIASMLCYIGAWITGIIFIAMEKENKTVKFHAWQSFLTFLPLMILSSIIGFIGSALVYSYRAGPYGIPIPSYNPAFEFVVWISWVFWVLTVILWVIFMIKAYQGEKFKLPIVGDIAEKQAQK